MKVTTESSYIPIVTKDGATNPRVNLDQDIQDCSRITFVSKHKQEPNEELLELFNEIIGSQ
jgi:exonuclease SbcD